MTDETTDNGMDRRNFIRRAGTVGAAGAMVWAAPSVTTLSRAFALPNGSPDCGRPNTGQSTGFKFVGSPPTAKINDPSIANDDKILLWREGIYTLNGLLTPDVGSPIESGETIAVYMLYSGTTKPDLQTVSGSVAFDGTVLGINWKSNSLHGTDGLFPSSTDYGDSSQTNWAQRGFEDDGGSPDTINGVNPKNLASIGAAIAVVCNTTVACDQMRIFVKCETA